MKNKRYRNKKKYYFTLIFSVLLGSGATCMCWLLVYLNGLFNTGAYAVSVGIYASIFIVGLSVIVIRSICSLEKEKEYTEELLRLKNEIQNQVDLDPLTMLYNKKVTEELVRQAICAMKKGQKGVFMVIDVDGFKSVNDTYGHPFGDKVLVELAARLRQIFRETDIVGRIGGDEFCVFYSGDFSREQIREKAALVSGLLCNIQVPQREDIQISCSCGISVMGREEKTFEQTYREADQALYEVKTTGKNGYAFYAEKSGKRTQHHI